MISKKSNPVPTVTSAIVTPADMLRVVIQHGSATRTSALNLCYSAAAYILLVWHFKDSKDKDYQTKSDAVEYLQKQIKEQANVQGGMLNLYIRNASTLVGVLVGSSKMFSATITELAQAQEPQVMVNILSDWMDRNNGKRVDSMSTLSEALGFKTSRPTGKDTPAVAADKAVNRVESALKAVEKLTTLAGGAGKVKEQSVAQTIVSTVKSPVILAREAVKRIITVQDLEMLIKFCQQHMEYLRKLSQQAQQETQVEQAKGTKARNAAFAKAKKRTTTTTTAVH